MALLVELAAENVGMDAGRTLEARAEIVLEAAGKAQHGLFGRVGALDQLRVAGPADLDAAEEIGLGARHLEQARRLERVRLLENLRIGGEAHLGAAAVVDPAELLEARLRNAAREALAIEHLAARDLDLQRDGEGIDDRDADAVQAARGLVDLRVELAARMERAHDDFERRLAGEFRVRVDGDAAAVVGDGEGAVSEELDLDPGGVAGHRLVHGIVDHLGEEVVQGLLVSAADIHAGAAAHRLEALEDLDVGGGIALLAGRSGGLRSLGRFGPGRGAAALGGVSVGAFGPPNRSLELSIVVESPGPPGGRESFSPSWHRARRGRTERKRRSASTDAARAFGCRHAGETCARRNGIDLLAFLVRKGKA